MVRLNTDVGPDGKSDKAHLFLEGKTKDRLIPEALCGDVAMGHFDLERASEAVQVLPVPTNIGRQGLWATLRHLEREGLLCETCLNEYVDETKGHKGRGRP